MNSRDTACLGVAAALALSAWACDAIAEEPPVLDRVPPARPAAHPERVKPARSAKVNPRAASKAPAKRQPARAPAVTALDADALLAPPPAPLVPPAAVLSAAPAPPPSVGLHGGSAAKASSSAASTNEAAAENPDALTLAERLLSERNPIELFESVIVPAARGVTIAEIQTEGAPAVTLSVRPTKITRGSGLVATGQF